MHLLIIRDNFPRSLKRNPIQRSLLLVESICRWERGLPVSPPEEIGDLFWNSEEMDVGWGYLEGSVVLLKVRREL